MSKLIRAIFFILATLGLVYSVGYMSGGQAKQGPGSATAGPRKGRPKSAKSVIRPLNAGVQRATLRQEYQRKVLGLFNSLDGGLVKSENQEHAEYNNVHQRVELILNHLGLLVELRDVNDPLLSDEEMSRYRGVVAWFRGDRVKRPANYLSWLARQATAGRKVVIVGGFGANRDEKNRPTPPGALQAAFVALGLEYRGQQTSDADLIALVSKTKEAEFERKLPPLLTSYQRQVLIDPAGTSYLKLKRRDIPQSESDMVVVTSKGGYVAPGYVSAETRFGRNFVNQWRVDPFTFFAKALGVPPAAPRLDFTSVNGSRIYYAHVDGDGLPSITWVDRRSLCADFARQEIYEKYDLPTTVSFVVAGVEPPPEGAGSRRRLETARKIAAMQNIELAVHGFAHPMNWRAYDKAVTSYEVPGYKMSAEKEITYALNYVNKQIAPPGKQAKVMLWTGWCNPAEDQLAIPYREGIYNMNGGDPRFDATFPSYMHLVPPMHKVGKYVQYFTSGPNDYILTNEWHPPYHRWGNLVDTLKRGGSPRRVVPMNVYYHFYVVERRSSLNAMKDVLEHVISTEPAPLFVSEYIDVVRDFATARVAPTEDGGWLVLNSGYMQSVRFDGLRKHVDWEKSRGVIGYDWNQKLDALYVHLGEGTEHRIYLRDAIRDRPHLRRSSAYLRGVKLEAARAVLTMRGIGRKHLTLGGMTPKARYEVSAKAEGAVALRGSVKADDQGLLRWSGDINGDTIAVTIERQEK